MLIGCHGSVWVPEFDAAGVAHALAMTRGAGFDLIEIPLMRPDALDVASMRAGLAQHELAATASLGLRPDLDLSSPDSEVSARGEAHLGRALEVLSDVGGTHLCGVIACAMQKYPEPATDAGRTNSVEALRRLGDRAEALGVTLAVEIINRYESNLLNTAQQGLDFVRDVGHDQVSIHLDTYHMNIEEADLREPLVTAGDRLGYLHAGESHRGYLGAGTVDFPQFFAAVTEVGYDGPLVFESFSAAVVHREFSTTLSIWRDLWSDSSDLGARACAFVRDGLEAAGRRA